MNNTITTHPIGAYCPYFTRLRLGKYGLIRTSKVCSNSILLTTLRGYWCWISLCYFNIFVLLLHSFWYYCTLFWYYCTLYCYYWTVFAIIAHFLLLLNTFLLLFNTLLLLLHTFLLLLHSFCYYYTLFCYYCTLFGCYCTVSKLRNFSGGQPNF